MNEGLLGKYTFGGERAATDDHPTVIHYLPLAASVSEKLDVGLLLKAVDVYGATAVVGAENTGVTAASATAITMDEVMDLYYSLRAPYRRNAVFIMNDSTIKAIRKLKNGNGDYLWQPSLTAGQPDTLLNRPVYTSSYMPAIAAGNKTILFGDLGYYWVADRQGRSFKRLNELYAATGQVGFLASERVDGKLILAEAVKVLQMKSA